MAQYNITPDTTFSTPYAADERVTMFLRSVYGWMCAGLGVTALVAFYVAQSPSLIRTIAGNPVFYWGLMIAQLGLVFFLSARVDKIAAGTASLLFVLYSALTGVTFAFILLAFTGASIATTFMISAGMFGALALYGTTTSRSLAGWGQFLFMGLIGVVLASFVGNLLAEQRLPVRARIHRRHRVHRAHRLRCAAPEGDGARAALRPARFLRHRRRADPVSGFHQPVPDVVAIHRKPPGVMSLDKLNAALVADVAALSAEGRAKAPERVIVGYVPPSGIRGPRYRLQGSDRDFLRMNSNSYLSLSNHPDVLAAADAASHAFGAGPGAVRFIDGTFSAHAQLEARIARFVGRPAARIFNSAYTTVLGLAITLAGPETFWIGDALNHNCIIRAMRIANVPSAQRAIYKHNDLADLAAHLERVPDGTGRVVVIFDGIFSMRGDNAPVDAIASLVARHEHRFRDGVITIMDDSHGVAAYGATGRGTEEHCAARVDIFVGTFGKAFGVNGGFVAGSVELVEAVRQKADTYIYTNPLGAADAAAAVAAVEVADGSEGQTRLANLRARTAQFRGGLELLGFESIPGPHPVVPLVVRDTARVRSMVAGLFDRGILAVGLTFPVVPRGDETIRFQINAAHTEGDISDLLSALKELKG